MELKCSNAVSCKLRFYLNVVEVEITQIPQDYDLFEWLRRGNLIWKNKN